MLFYYAIIFHIADAVIYAFWWCFIHFDYAPFSMPLPLMRFALIFCRCRWCLFRRHASSPIRYFTLCCHCLCQLWCCWCHFHMIRYARYFSPPLTMPFSLLLLMLPPWYWLFRCWLSSSLRYAIFCYAAVISRLIYFRWLFRLRCCTDVFIIERADIMPCWCADAAFFFMLISLSSPHMILCCAIIDYFCRCHWYFRHYAFYFFFVWRRFRRHFHWFSPISFDYADTLMLAADFAAFLLLLRAITLLILLSAFDWLFHYAAFADAALVADATFRCLILSPCLRRRCRLFSLRIFAFVAALRHIARCHAAVTLIIDAACFIFDTRLSFSFVCCRCCRFFIIDYCCCCRCLMLLSCFSLPLLFIFTPFALIIFFRCCLYIDAALYFAAAFRYFFHYFRCHYNADIDIIDTPLSPCCRHFISMPIDFMLSCILLLLSLSFSFRFLHFFRWLFSSLLMLSFRYAFAMLKRHAFFAPPSFSPLPLLSLMSFRYFLLSSPLCWCHFAILRAAITLSLMLIIFWYFAAFSLRFSLWCCFIIFAMPLPERQVMPTAADAAYWFSSLRHVDSARCCLIIYAMLFAMLIHDTPLFSPPLIDDALMLHAVFISPPLLMLPAFAISPCCCCHYFAADTPPFSSRYYFLHFRCFRCADDYFSLILIISHTIISRFRRFRRWYAAAAAIDIFAPWLFSLLLCRHWLLMLFFIIFVDACFSFFFFSAFAPDAFISDADTRFFDAFILFHFIISSPLW